MEGKGLDFIPAAKLHIAYAGAAIKSKREAGDFRSSNRYHYLDCETIYSQAEKLLGPENELTAELISRRKVKIKP